MKRAWLVALLAVAVGRAGAEPSLGETLEWLNRAIVKDCGWGSSVKYVAARLSDGDSAFDYTTNVNVRVPRGGSLHIWSEGTVEFRLDGLNDEQSGVTSGSLAGSRTRYTVWMKAVDKDHYPKDAQLSHRSDGTRREDERTVSRPDRLRICAFEKSDADQVLEALRRAVRAVKAKQ